jgi:cytosine/adenosine deaminase-related metal-dependent hydrolase
MFLRADVILPIAGPPIRPGWIEIADSRIRRVGAGEPPIPGRDLGHVAVLPGLVNAHTHLELSWMAGRVPPAGSMVDWIRALIRQRVHGPPGGPDEEIAGAAGAAATMRDTGTVLAGDISNTLITPRLFLDVGLSAAIFHEQLAFNAADPAAIVGDAWTRVDRLAAELDAGDAARLTYSVVAHAPAVLRFAAGGASPAVAPGRREWALDSNEELIAIGEHCYRAKIGDVSVSH